MTKPLQNVPTGKESPNSLKEGWLLKQGNFIKNWRPRWFQIKDSILYYYKDPFSEACPTNFFILAGASVKEEKRYGEGCFELVMANGERRLMQAKTKCERDEWIHVLNQIVQTRMPNPAKKASDPQSMFLNEKLTPEHFNFLKVLGKGNYGKVMLATRKDDNDGQYFAIKIIKKSALIDEESLEHVLSENRVLQGLQHPFLVRLFCSFQTKDRLYFVMEYVKGGELFFHLGREKRFSEERTRIYAAQILLALHYLHTKGIVYRDLKLENLLLDEKGYIKITDFGLCKEGISTEIDRTSTFCGTPEYLAPEILEEEHYGRSVDWWALGVVLYEMLVGRPPFGPCANMESLFQCILHQKISFPSSLSPSARSLLESLLQRDHNARIGCGPKDGEEIMEHPFFLPLDWRSVEECTIKPPFCPVISNDLDTRNFDKEFTDLPVTMTPASSSGFLVNAQNCTLKNFTFVDSNAFLSK